MKINVRQICLIMAAYTVVARLLLFPMELSNISGRDYLFSALAGFAVQTVVIWAVAYLCSRTQKTFFQLLEDTFGNIVARIIYGLFALFFMAGTLVPILEHKLYVHAIFYDTLPSLTVFLPFFFFAVFAASKGFKNIGRSADICFPLFALCFVFIMVMSFGEAKFAELLPVFKTPVTKIFGGTVAGAYRFVEPCWLLMFMGRFEYKKGDAAKITVSYAVAVALVLLFLAVLYGIYGSITPSRQFAVSKTALYFPAIDMLGRIDLLVLYVMEIVMLFWLVLNIQLAVQCISECTGYKDKFIISLAVNAVFIVLTVTLDHKFSAVQGFFASWFWIATLLFTVIFPLCAWALKKGAKR